MIFRNRKCAQLFVATLIALITITVPYTAFAAGSVKWEGDVSSNWNDANNWEDNTFPLATEKAVIDPDNYTNAPIVSASSIPFFTADQIEVVNGGILTIQADVTVNDKVKVDGVNTTNPVINMSGGTLTILNNKKPNERAGYCFTVDKKHDKAV